MARLESLGPAHPLYIHNFGEYTQVAAWKNTELLAIFVGPFAKINAADFIGEE